MTSVSLVRLLEYVLQLVRSLHMIRQLWIVLSTENSRSPATAIDREV